MSAVKKHIRERFFPHIWCPGCGHGTILNTLVRTTADMGLDQNSVVTVSGIGCSARISGYLDYHTLHTLHGRALAFATGVKMTKPELTVIVPMGDGDALAIGGNHFIHACRRNIGICAIVMNNNIYGMTGGQASPTTPPDAFASTAPYGAVDPPFDICKLAIGAGASYVARATIAQPQLCENFIKKGIENDGFAVIEIMTHCHTQFGRKNKRARPLDNFNFFKDRSVMKAKADGMSEEELEGKIVIGELRNVPGEEYTKKYDRVIERARG